MAGSEFDEQVNEPRTILLLSNTPIDSLVFFMASGYTFHGRLRAYYATRCARRKYPSQISPKILPTESSNTLLIVKFLNACLL